MAAEPQPTPPFPTGGTISALLSYSHADDDVTASRLVDELRLRGIVTTRDVENFGMGRRIGSEMDAGIDGHLVVSHLTENALSSEPVVSRELRPALATFRQTGWPVVVPVPRDLGEDRPAIDATIAGRVPVSIQATWLPIAPSGVDHLPIEFCADVARGALRSVLREGRGPADGRWDLQVVSRGTSRAGSGFNVDATSLVGGRDARPGDGECWQRIFNGLCDLEEALADYGGRREIQIVPFCHLTAGVATGYVFRRAKGWGACVLARDGEACAQGSTVLRDGLRISPVDEGPAADGRLFVEVDLAGRPPREAVDELIRRSGGVPAGRLVIDREPGADLLSAEQIAGHAVAIALAIKYARAKVAAKTVHLFIAAPAAFAVMLGAELNALCAELVLYEHAGEYDDYVETLTINAR